MSFEEDDVAEVMKSEKHRGRKRPIDFEERKQQQLLQAKVLRAMQEKRWFDVEAMLEELYNDDADGKERAFRALNDYRRANP